MVHDTFARTTCYKLGGTPFSDKPMYHIVAHIHLPRSKKVIFKILYQYFLRYPMKYPIRSFFFCHEFSRFVSRFDSMIFPTTYPRLLRWTPRGGAIALGHPLGATARDRSPPCCPSWSDRARSNLYDLARCWEGIGGIQRMDIICHFFRTSDRSWLFILDLLD